MTEMVLFTLESNRASDDHHGNVTDLLGPEERPGWNVALSRTGRHSLFERYRSAVHAFTYAVDRLDDDLSMDFSIGWKQAEVARQRVDICAELLLSAQEPNSGQGTDQRTEDLILGDQGQSGG
jgi:hypothetical protein